MKKNILIISLLLILTSCGDTTSTNSANLINSVNSTGDNIITSASDNIITSTSSPSLDNAKYDSIAHSAKIDFSKIINKLNNSYSDVELVCSEEEDRTQSNVLVSFDAVSHQTTNINCVPVIKAGDDSPYSGPKHITLLSDTTFDISTVRTSLTIWNDSDLNNIGTDYYVGIEYLENDVWLKLEAIKVKDMQKGATTENTNYEFKINKPNIHNVRLTFDFPYSSGNVRFGVWDLEYDGIEYIPQNNELISNITIQNKHEAAYIGGTLTLETNFDANKEWLNYESSDRSIAVMNKNGTIKPLSVGVCEIKVSNGSSFDSFTLNVLKQGSSASKIIQETAYFDGKLPEGFSANFDLTFFNGTYLNFKKQGNAVTTKKYNNIDGNTSVVLNMCLSSQANIEDSELNVFTVEGLDSNGEVIEQVQKTNLVNLEFADITFDFTNANIKSYRLLFETKYNYGKNYVVKSIQIFNK